MDARRIRKIRFRSTRVLKRGEIPGSHSQAVVNFRDCGGNQGDQVKVSLFPLDAYQVRGVRLPRACDRLVAPAPVAAAA